ncbi:hypothetical protein D3C75_713990 [compost metagenome]
MNPFFYRRHLDSNAHFQICCTSRTQLAYQIIGQIGQRQLRRLNLSADQCLIKLRRNSIACHSYICLGNRYFTRFVKSGLA